MDIKPYSNEALNVLYNALFCDMLQLYKNDDRLYAGAPWDVLFSEKTSDAALQLLAADPSAESRIQLLAYQQLIKRGCPVVQQELLGVVIEVRMEKGLDVLAAYKDGTARYINQAEKLIMWETKTAHAEKLIGNLFAEGGKVVSKIGAWNRPRLPQPGNGEIRLNFLVSDGLYFGQGPFDALAKDAMGGPVIHAATQLMVFLTGTVTVD
jgi:hypothetical protein